MTITQIERRAAGDWVGLAPHLHPVLRRVYAGRGIGYDADLDLSLERMLPVSTLQGVDAAARLLAAHRTGRVLIIGDFDADGATSTALMARALHAMRFAHVDYLVPSRFRFGYGLTPEIVAMAAEREPSLIVTVDNGVSSFGGVDKARELGIPVLVTDHHLPGMELPRADVIVNPNLADSRFASGALAGVGVAFYVMAALARCLDTRFRVAELLDLVAVGTVADMVPLDRNNRVLVEQGLKRIRAGRCVPGVRALLESARRSLEHATAADLGFTVGPRLNAAGRLADMSVGIACLLAPDPAEAARLAELLARLNAERREIERRMQAEALELASAELLMEQGDAAGICLFDSGWHQGVVGLVAGRIKDRLHRPVIAFACTDDGTLRGSARSIPGVNIRDALGAIAARRPGLIDKFGGHAMAAGMSLHRANLEEFRSAFAQEIAARSDSEASRGVILSDGVLSSAEICVDTARLLRGAGPWGQGFPEPVFDGEFRVIDLAIVGERHLRMNLRAADLDGCAPSAAARFEAIAFGYVGGGAEDAHLAAGDSVRLAYRLEVNEYRGTERMQLNCQHLVRVRGTGS